MKLHSFYKSPIFLKSLFVVSIFAIFFISAVTFKHINLLNDSARRVKHSYDVNLELERLFSYLKDSETGQRGFLITKDSTFLVPYINAKKKIDHSFTIVKEYTKKDPAQEDNVRKLQFYINKRQNYLSIALHLSLQKPLNDPSLKRELLVGKETMDSVRSQINQMILLEKKALKGRDKRYNETIKVTPVFIYVTLLITLLLISISYIRINRDLEKMQVSNNRLTVLNESSNLAEIVGNFGSWQFNIDNDEYTFSDNIYRLLGCEPQSFKEGQNDFVKFVHDEDLHYFEGITSNRLKENDLPAFTYRVIRKDNQRRYFRTTGRIVTNKSGNNILIGTTSDVTDEVLASLSLEQQNIELEASNKELLAFNYVASHDLQEPLRKIQTFISRLSEKESEHLTDNGKEYITRIHASVDRMRILIDDLLQYSRANKTEKIFEKVNLNDLLENAKFDLAQSIEEKNATIKSDTLPTMTVIPFQIQQLFINLIGNSLKYSREKVKPKIKITYQKVSAFEEALIPKNTKDKFCKITFEDNGIGFEQEYAEKIFILFNRLHNKNEYAGTGIGLAICKKIVENHRGYIFAEGKPNKGAVFTIYLSEDC
ncbi:CHASE3 domain-containing protein [Flavobacterium phycosphaerae]|uniref:CHASE3 domain-containing protein n=1 Tax=Flavobacterium phycosphaerae TaxID=2697515 RepID=UPI00138ADFC4|nr:CHASE3 domain-containing protein [Flavobacterium phycosphaerae]